MSADEALSTLARNCGNAMPAEPPFQAYPAHVTAAEWPPMGTCDAKTLRAVPVQSAFARC